MSSTVFSGRSKFNRLSVIRISFVDSDNEDRSSSSTTQTFYSSGFLGKKTQVFSSRSCEMFHVQSGATRSSLHSWNRRLGWTRTTANAVQTAQTDKIEHKSDSNTSAFERRTRSITEVNICDYGR